MRNSGGRKANKSLWDRGVEFHTQKTQQIESYRKELLRFQRSSGHTARKHVWRSIERGRLAGLILLWSALAFVAMKLLSLKLSGLFDAALIAGVIYAFLWFFIHHKYRLMYLATLGEERQVIVESLSREKRHKYGCYYEVSATYTDPITEFIKRYNFVHIVPNTRWGNDGELAFKIGDEVTIYVASRNPDDYVYLSTTEFLTHCLDGRRLSSFSEEERNKSERHISARTRIAVLAVLAIPLVALGLGIFLYLALHH